MPIFYRGAGPGSYWEVNDARLSGFTSQSPGMPPGHDRLIRHIARGTVFSPYVSLTRSFGVAWDHAINSGITAATATARNPGCVYEIDLNEPLPQGLVLLDPVREVANNWPGPLAATSSHHDGPPSFLLGVIDPKGMKRYLKSPYVQPPPGGGTTRPPSLSPELETLVRALRDAEIPAVGTIPSNAVVNRYPVH